MRAYHWFLVLLTATLFGSSFVFVKSAVQEIPPFSLAAARVVLAAMPMTAVLYMLGGRLPTSLRHWIPLVILGFLTAAVPYASIAWGQTKLDASLGGILFATIPIFTVLAAPLFTPEKRVGGLRLFGILAAFTGVITVVGPQSLDGISGHLAGSGATLLAAFCYAIGNIYARLKTEIKPLVLASGQLISGSFILLPLAVLTESNLEYQPGLAAILNTLALAFLSTAIPVLLMFSLIRSVGAINASVLAFFIPVATVALGALVLQESLQLHEVTGFGFILVGALLSTGTIKRLTERTA